MRKFYVISNKNKDPEQVCAKKICDYIINAGGECEYYSSDKIQQSDDYNYTDKSIVPEDTECAIVLGGDGTLLQAARDLNELNIPLFGVNIGTLGFLTDADMTSFGSAIDDILAGNYEIDRRMMLNGRIFRKGQQIYENTALNDIVINRCGNLRVIDFDIYVNDQYLSSYSADGVIVSTATGSTAYSLSAGGPIIQPNAELMMLTPICPHTLNKRSIVFGAKDTITIVMSDNKRVLEERIATYDGEKFYNVITDDKIVITKSDKASSFIKTNKDSFLQRIREKLM